MKYIAALESVSAGLDISDRNMIIESRFHTRESRKMRNLSTKQ